MVEAQSSIFASIVRALVAMTFSDTSSGGRTGFRYRKNGFVRSQLNIENATVKTCMKRQIVWERFEISRFMSTDVENRRNIQLCHRPSSLARDIPESVDREPSFATATSNSKGMRPVSSGPQWTFRKNPPNACNENKIFIFTDSANFIEEKLWKRIKNKNIPADDFAARKFRFSTIFHTKYPVLIHFFEILRPTMYFHTSYTIFRVVYSPEPRSQVSIMYPRT